MGGRGKKCGLTLGGSSFGGFPERGEGYWQYGQASEESKLPRYRNRSNTFAKVFIPMTSGWEDLCVCVCVTCEEAGEGFIGFSQGSWTWLDSFI